MIVQATGDKGSFDKVKTLIILTAVKTTRTTFTFLSFNTDY
jgi:hypothetical protein